MIIRFIDGENSYDYEITKQEEILLKELQNADFKHPVNGVEFKGIPAWIVNFIYNRIQNRLNYVLEMTGEGSRNTSHKKKYAILEKLIKEENPILFPKPVDNFNQILYNNNKKGGKK